MKHPPYILYLGEFSNNASQCLKLDGIRRWGAALGWETIMVERPDSTPENLPALLRQHHPTGCICEGSGHWVDLPPRLFGKIPVAYIEYPPKVAVTAIQDGDAKTTAIFPGTSAPTSGTAADGFRQYTVCSNEYSSVLRVGGWGGNINSNQFLTGTVKNFRYYDHVLTDEELLRNRQVDSVRYFGALAVTNLVVEIEDGSDFVAIPAPGAYFVEGSHEFSVAPGVNTPTRYKLQDWDETLGKWGNTRHVDGTNFVYEASATSPAKMKVT